MVRTPTASAMSPRLSMVPRAFSDGNWKPPVGAAAAGAGPAAVTSLMVGKLLGSICRVHGYRGVNGCRCDGAAAHPSPKSGRDDGAPSRPTVDSVFRQTSIV